MNEVYNNTQNIITGSYQFARRQLERQQKLFQLLQMLHNLRIVGQTQTTSRYAHTHSQTYNVCLVKPGSQYDARSMLE